MNRFKAWWIDKWTRLKRWGLALLIALGMVAPLALADDNTISWTNATLWDDGTPMSIDDIDETVLYVEIFPLGTDVAAIGRNYTELVRVPPTTTTYVHADQPNGIYCYVATHIATNEQGVTEESVYSGESCKTIDVRIPGAPEGLSVS